nr:protein kinase [Frankia sp. R43]
MGEPGRPESAPGTVFSPLAPQDPRVVGGYLIRARIGEGGMGAVFLSYTPGGRPVALKVARPEFAADPEFRRRFRTEVAIAQRVQGLYTAPVIDADPEAPQPWLATAYVAAPSLAVTVGRQGALPVETVLVLIAGVAEALQSIHAAEIIHRDLKPGNVILAADGPRVIDFGISRATESSSGAITQTGVRVGTPAFMSPEQVQGAALGPAVDIFALGSTAYYAVTGELPFGADAAVFNRIEKHPPAWDRCPDQIRGLLEACVDKDPARRPTPAVLIDLCREASTDERLRIGEGWLPATVVADLTQYSLTPPPPPPLPSGGTVGHVPTGPIPPASSPWGPPSAPPTAGSPSAGSPRGKQLAWAVGGLCAAALLLAVVFTALNNDSPDKGATGDGLTPQTVSANESTFSSEPTSSSEPTATRGSSPSPEKSADPASQGVDRYLSEFTALESAGAVETGAVAVNGQQRTRSILIRAVGDKYAANYRVGKVDYDLGRHFQKFQAVVGLADDARSTAVYQVSIYGDNQRLADHTIRLGESIPIDIDVRGILRLRLEITHTDGDSGEGYSRYDSRVVFGEAKVVGSADEVPS